MVRGHLDRIHGLLSGGVSSTFLSGCGHSVKPLEPSGQC
jgi:hypothetical protein